MSGRRAPLVALVMFVLSASVGVAWSAFTATTSNPTSNFSAASSFLDHFEVDAVPDQSSGRSFLVTVRAKMASGAALTSYNGTVTFSTNSGTITPTGSYSFFNGVLTQAVTISGPHKTNQTITATGSGKTATSNAFVLNSWQYYFAKSTANTGSNCGSATRLRDMDQGYAGSDPEELFSRTTGGAIHLRFCSPALAGSDSLSAGTTTVTAWTANAAGSGCGISATIYKNSGGTLTTLGSSSLTVPNQSPITQRTWTISTNGTTFAAGDRLVVHFTMGDVKACDSTDIHYGGTTRRSNVQFPGPGGSAYRDAVTETSGLVGYWRFDETSGTTAFDSVSPPFNGTYAGSPALGANGLLESDNNTAVDHDAVDDRIYVPDNAAYDFAGTAPFSLEIWINPDVVDTTCRRLFSNEITDAAGTQGYILYVCNGGFGTQRRRDGVNNTLTSANTYASVGTKRHVVSTYDGTTLRLYVDGTQVASTGSSASLIDNPNPLGIGTYSTGGTRFDGRLDEAAIYNTALSAATVRAHYNAR